MRVAIVGHAGEKFTATTEAKARALIRELLEPATLMVSGGCHMGGIDIWAEEEAVAMGIQRKVFKPMHRSWAGGYKQRNLDIARNCDIAHSIVVAEFPPGYTGMRFPYCYHCRTDDHIKSGGCWTVKQARLAGALGHVHVIR